MNKKSIADIRREYTATNLCLEHMPSNPFEMFDLWYQEILSQEPEDITDPTAFVLSTVDQHGMPDSRVVLLKAVLDSKFIFYTNYLSEKGDQLSHRPNVAMNFYWPKQCQQIRIRGTVEKIAAKNSADYFLSRPYESQVSSIVSKQSQHIDPDKLGSLFEEKIKQWKGKTLDCPRFCGGYAITPVSFEFWHGKQARLHDRVQYFVKNSQWCKQVLAP